MTNVKRFNLLLVAALGLLTTVTACRSRGEFIGEVLQETPVRTVSDSVDDQPAEDAVAAVDETPVDRAAPSDPADVTWSDPPYTPEPVSVEPRKPAAADARLETAGVVLESDAQGRVVGADMTETRVSEAVVQSLAEMTDLQWADFRGTGVTDSQLATVAALPHLQLLALGDTKITDAGLRHLSRHQELRFLSLDRTSVTDAGLGFLIDLPKLEGLSLLGTGVSRSGAAAFEAEHPGCRTILGESAPEKARQPRRDAPADSGGDPTASAEQWHIEALDPEPAVTPRNEDHRVSDQMTLPQNQSLNEVLRKKLMDPEVLHALCQHLLEEGEYDKAVLALKSLTAIEPDNQQAQFDLGIALARGGKFDVARPILSSVVGEATALYNLGVVTFEMEQRPLSEWYFSRAIEVEPNFPDAEKWLHHLRNTAEITPASHAPDADAPADLIELLISELGTSEPSNHKPTVSAGIQIVPSPRGDSR